MYISEQELQEIRATIEVLREEIQKLRADFAKHTHSVTGTCYIAYHQRTSCCRTEVPDQITTKRDA